MKRILFIFVFLSVSAIHVFSQIKCVNNLLSELIEQLPENQLKEDVLGDFVLPSVCSGKPLIVQRNKEGIINHLGIKIFNRDIINKHPSPIYLFIERYFLELLLQPDEESLKGKLQMERVHITSEVCSFHSYRKGLEDIITNVSTDMSVYITCNNNRYSVSCMKNNKILVKISFPVRYELITGYTKLEAENSVYSSLLRFNKNKYNSLKTSDVSVYKDNIYCANVDYYVMEDIVSTSFYKKLDDNYIPILSSDFMPESIYNLFNSRYDWNVEAEVNQSLYGSKNISFNISLAKLIDYFVSNNCSLYTGIRKIDKSVVEGVVMIVNMELGYQHILTFTFDKNLFEQPTQYKIAIKMYNYVPIHNISSLFVENN